MALLSEINDDIQWRMSELASLKTIPLRYNLLIHHKKLLIKYAIPSIYSIWEGFVKNSFELYVNEINSLNIPVKDTHINILTHALSSHDKLSLENPRIHFKTKREFIEYYQDKISQPLFLTNKLPTKSNIDFEVINEILLRFNLDVLHESFKMKLRKLLRFRNSISHGDSSIPVDMEDLTYFSMLINDLMIEIFNRIEDGYISQSFKKQ